MVNYEERYFIQTWASVMLQASTKRKAYGNYGSGWKYLFIPFESLPRVGVRNLMESDEADLIMKKLFTPKQESSLPASLTLMQIQQSIVDYKLEQQVQLLIGLLYWKYAEGKKVSVIRNVFPVLRVYSVRSCPLFLTFPRIFLWSVWRIATAAWHRLQKMVQSHYFFIC